MPGRPWQEWEDECLKKWYGKEPIAEIAELLDRTTKAVHQRARKAGLSDPNVPEAVVKEFTERYHPLGYSDEEVGAKLREAGWKTGRKRVSEVRAKLGLPSNKGSEHQRKQVAERTRQQLKAAGCKTLAELRSKRWKRFATDHGWPEGLTVREAQVCEVLWRFGPMNRRSIAKVLGMKSDGRSKDILKCSTPSNSSLTAVLIQKGLLIRIRKGERVIGKGKGRSRDIYALKPGVQPDGKDAEARRCGTAHGSVVGDPVDASPSAERGIRRDSRKRHRRYCGVKSGGGEVG